MHWGGQDIQRQVNTALLSTAIPYAYLSIELVSVKMTFVTAK